MRHEMDSRYFLYVHKNVVYHQKYFWMSVHLLWYLLQIYSLYLDVTQNYSQVFAHRHRIRLFYSTETVVRKAKQLNWFYNYEFILQYFFKFMS